MTNFRVTAGAILGVMTLIGTCTAASAQTMSVSPQALSFIYQIGGPSPAAQNLFVSAGVATEFGVTTSGAPWATISPTYGVTPGYLVVTVRPPADAGPGVLSGSIVIAANVSTATVRVVVPITLQIVGPPQGNLVVSPNSLVADYWVGGPAPPLMPVSISSTSGPAAFSLSTGTSSGGSWLTASASSYTTPAVAYVGVTPTPGLVPGVHTGTVAVVPAYAGGATRFITVTLRVYATGTIVTTPSILGFEYQTGGALPDLQYLRVNHSGGAATGFSVSVSTPTGPWLAVAPTGGITPTTLAVQVFPTVMSVQTHYGTITITPSGGGVATVVPVTLTVSSTPELRTVPNSLTFNAQAGAGPAPAQYLQVSSTGTPLGFTASVVGPTWITVSGAAQVTPASVSVGVNPPASTAAGTYMATVILTPASSASSTLAVPVTINVKAPNYLTLSRNSISFVYAAGGAYPAGQIVSVMSSGESVKFQAAGSSNWISVATTGPYTPATLTLGAFPSNLAPGVYKDRVNVTSDSVTNSPQVIDVTLTVTGDPIFSAAPFGMMFSHQIGAAPPSAQLAVITNTMPSQNFTVSAETDNGGDWLLVAGGGPAPATVGAAIAAQVLTNPGIYTGSLVVKPISGSTPELRVPIVVNVTRGPALRTSTTSLAFQHQIGGAAPMPQTVSAATTAGPIGFYTSVRTADGAPWLKVTPDFASAPASLTVTVDPVGLAPGEYLGLVTLSGQSSESVLHYVPVTFKVSTDPILTVPAQTVVFNGTVGGPRPASQTVRASNTGASTEIASSAQSSGWLSVEPATAVGAVNLSVQAMPDGLAAGFYPGLITVQIPGVTNSMQYIPAVLSLVPAQ